MTPPTSQLSKPDKPKRARTLKRAALAAAVAGVAAVIPAGPASATPDIGSAHRSVTTADGQSYHLRLTAGPTVLPASGGTVHVMGTGYNRSQGIFLAFCAIPKGVRIGDPSTYTSLPGPCLGGREAKDGSARRITDTGTGTAGVTIPYQDGGSFVTTLENVRPEIAEDVVCGKTVECAVVTRADFTATDLRLYDQYIPVRFASAAR